MNRSNSRTQKKLTNASRSEQKQRGLSLVELMIGMVLGIVVVGGCITIFTGVVRSSSVNQTVSTLQSKARFAIDMIGHDVRSAGFLGCASSEETELNIATPKAPTNNLDQTAITGAVVGATDWTPAIPAGFIPPTGVGAPVEGTQALSVQSAQYRGSPLASSMSGQSASIELAAPLGVSVYSGDLMIVSDCTRADLFEVSSVSGPVSGKTIQPADSLAKAYALSVDFPANTRAMLFSSSIYYIGDTQRVTEQGDAVYSLFQQTYPYAASNPPLELIEGVDQMQLEFGVRLATNAIAYMEPDDAGFDPAAIETVRVGLLMSSMKSFSDVDDTREFTLVGRAVVPASATATNATYPADKRMRMPFNATFSVRNRNMQ
ncbi:MAG: PilW family protein [Granulosicoccus sp.]